MKRPLVVSMLALLIVCAAAAPARAEFPRGENIESGTQVEAHRLVANDRGDRAVIYHAGARPRVALAPAGRRFGPPQDIPGASAGFEFDVAIGPRGDALILWRYDDGTTPPGEIDVRDGGCCVGVKAAVVPARGAPRPATTLWPERTEVSVVAMAIRDARHYGVVAEVGALPSDRNNYPVNDLELQARFAGHDGDWGAVEDVPGDAGTSALFGSSALAITSSGARLVYYRTGFAERVRTRSGRWSRERRLLGRRRRIGNFLLRTDASGGLVAAWSESSRNAAALRVASGAPGRRPHVRTVDRASRPDFAFATTLDVAQNGTALATWQIGEQRYRSERRARGRFGARRLAFAVPFESTFAGTAVSPAGRWVAGIVTGGRFRDDAMRLRLVGARFGRPAGRDRLVHSAPQFRALAPVMDRAGRITFVFWGQSGIGARTGR